MNKLTRIALALSVFASLGSVRANEMPGEPAPHTELQASEMPQELAQELAEIEKSVESEFKAEESPKEEILNEAVSTEAHSPEALPQS